MVKSLKKFESLSGTISILLTLSDQNRRCRRFLPRRLSRRQILILRSLSPPVVAEGPGPVISQERSSSLPYCQHQHQPHQSATKKCPCPFCASMPIQRRQRKRKAVVVNEETAHDADGNWDMGGKRSRKRHKGERAKQRAKRTKKRAGKGKGRKWRKR